MLLRLRENGRNYPDENFRILESCLYVLGKIRSKFTPRTINAAQRTLAKLVLPGTTLADRNRGTVDIYAIHMVNIYAFQMDGNSGTITST